MNGHTAAPSTTFTIASHVGDPNWLRCDCRQRTSYAHKLAASFACSAVKLDNWYCLRHFGGCMFLVLFVFLFVVSGRAGGMPWRKEELWGLSTGQLVLCWSVGVENEVNLHRASCGDMQTLKALV
jgi:hypothetical protein